MRNELLSIAVCLSWCPVGAQFSTLHIGPAGSSLEAIVFPTPSTGYTIGKDGAAFTSIDGGLTWSPLSSGSGAWLFGVSFLDDLNGFTSGGGAAMLHTIDGGTSWTPQSVPFTECIYQVSAVNDTLIYGGAWGGYFFRSTDGGVNWTMSSVDPGSQGWIFAMQFLNADTGWTAGADGDIYRTVDGGQSWTPCASGTSNQLRGMHFPDATTGYAVGFSSTVRKSVDGGATWSTINTGYPDDTYYAAWFTDADHGVIAGGFYSGSWQGVIMRTDDGGANWARIHTGGPVLNGVRMNNGHIFAVGVNQVIIADLVASGTAHTPAPPQQFVAPNPVTGPLTVSWPGQLSPPSWLQIQDAVGRVMLVHRPTGDTETIDLGSFGPGTYLLCSWWPDGSRAVDRLVIAAR